MPASNPTRKLWPPRASASRVSRCQRACRASTSSRFRPVGSALGAFRPMSGAPPPATPRPSACCHPAPPPRQQPPAQMRGACSTRTACARQSVSQQAEAPATATTSTPSSSTQRELPPTRTLGLPHENLALCGYNPEGEGGNIRVRQPRMLRFLRFFFSRHSLRKPRPVLSHLK